MPLKQKLRWIYGKKKARRITYFFLLLKFRQEVGRIYGRLFRRQPVESLVLFPISKFQYWLLRCILMRRSWCGWICPKNDKLDLFFWGSKNMTSFWNLYGTVVVLPKYTIIWNSHMFIKKTRQIIACKLGYKEKCTYFFHLTSIFRHVSKN